VKVSGPDAGDLPGDGRGGIDEVDIGAKLILDSSCDEGEMGAGEDDFISPGLDERAEIVGNDGLAGRGMLALLLSDTNQFGRNNSNDLGSGGVAFADAAVEFAVGGGLGGEDADDARAGALGGGFDGRFHTDDGQAGELVAEEIKGGGAGGIAGQDDDGTALPHQEMGDSLDIMANLVYWAGAVGQMGLIRDKDGGMIGQQAVNFTENRQAADP
jgi:hypothetical protein